MRGKTIKDRLIKIVHVKQNKQSLCGKIPAGLLPPLQLVTADPWRDALLGFLKHDNKGRKQNTASGASKCSANEAATAVEPHKQGEQSGGGTSEPFHLQRQKPR